MSLATASSAGARLEATYKSPLTPSIALPFALEAPNFARARELSGGDVVANADGEWTKSVTARRAVTAVA
ncbi:MAG: hypothetical protein ABR498_04050 [Candidatus Dormibacteria bacterium]